MKRVTPLKLIISKKSHISPTSETNCRLVVCLVALLMMLPTLVIRAQDASVVTPPAYPTTLENFVRTWDLVKPETNEANVHTHNDPQTARMSTQYVDGLGRPIQTIIKKGSQVTGGVMHDLVSPTVYDDFGRLQRQYLPFADTGVANGFMKDKPFQVQNYFYSDANATSPIKGQGETYYYSKTEFEPSPLNRTARTYSPGNNWVHQGKGIKMAYWVNTVTDSVKLWTVTNSGITGQFGTYATTTDYPAGDLIKKVATDEEEKQVIEFTNKEGLVILKKVQLTASADTGHGSGHVGWLCTYYIYDGLNQLRAVIQPEGVVRLMSQHYNFNPAIIDSLTFRYEYDGLRHMVMKKVPGAGAVYMVYDKRHRLVLTQDANLRSQSQWHYTQYDAINRPMATGLWNNGDNFSTHLDAARVSTTYPPGAGGAAYEVLTETYYDNYGWRSGEGNPLSGTYNTDYNTYLEATSNTSFPYPQRETAASTLVKGQVTGTMTKVLGTSTYLYAVNFYDDKGRLIQVQTDNLTGGTDVITTQYTWAGQPYITVMKHQKSDANAQTTVTVTRMNYDALGRVASIDKKLSNTLMNGGAMSSYTTVVAMAYDALGQVKEKKLGSASAPLETLIYDYNIQGWQLGVNRDYAKSTTATDHYFGMDLAYDKTSIQPSGGASIGSYSAAQYNGNIAGTVWRSEGQPEIKKYDYTYDAVNRLTAADYHQHVTGATWSQTTQNFSVSNLTYDANGNILSLTRKEEASENLDILAYAYRGNQLIKILDIGNPEKGFKDGFDGSIEYGYDANGNMIEDFNKDITDATDDGITYNYLNLPATVRVGDKGSIDYYYDAVGTKLKKVVHETDQPDQATLYLADAIYENDVLQFIVHEEGRIVMELDNSFSYEYHIRDHLGNTRLTLTTNPKTITFPATFESENAAEEEALYSYLPETRVTFNSADANSDGGNEVVRLNATRPSGAGLSLPVSRGDILNMEVYAYYEGGSGYSTTSGVTAFITAVAGTFGGLNGGSPVEQATYDAINSAYNGGPAAMQGAQNDGIPAAYLNYILFDHKMVAYQHGFVQISNAASYGHEKISLEDIAVAKRGFVYVFLSNESAIGDVYFDDMEVVSIEGFIVQEDSYFPFGLTFNKYRRESSMKNKFLFNNKEVEADMDVDWYHYGARLYDAASARFPCIDPLSERFAYISPYNYAENEPIGSIDLWGLQRWRVNGRERNNSPSSLTQNIATVGAALEHPQAASRVGTVERGGTNISTVAGRVARHVAENRNMSTGIGTQRNAYRHALWAATISAEFGWQAAEDITNSHEGIRVNETSGINMGEPFQGNMELADNVVDLLNNFVGMQLGVENNGASASEIASMVLDVFVTEGLWTASTDENGNITIQREAISKEVYKKAKGILSTLDENGMTDTDRNELEEERQRLLQRLDRLRLN